jgi:hypothetical protein
MGFIKLNDEAYEAHEKWEEATKPPKTTSQKVVRKVKGLLGDELNPDRLEFNYPLKWDQVKSDITPIGIRHTVDLPKKKDLIIPKDHHHRFEFAYRAGHWYGYRPKPDTHIISCTVNYTQQITENPQNSSEKVLQAHADMEIAIYPSLTGMLFGSILGSFFGTIAQLKWSDPNTIISQIVLNLILGFIAAVILMRRKNVDSFITIEDFWGGIVIGFVVGYSGFLAFQKLAGLLTH